MERCTSITALSLHYEAEEISSAIKDDANAAWRVLTISSHPRRRNQPKMWDDDNIKDGREAFFRVLGFHLDDVFTSLDEVCRSVYAHQSTQSCEHR